MNIEKQEKLSQIYKNLKAQLDITQIFVPGVGNSDADIMLVGEAPGAKETELGRPFVGAAGKNLDEFLDTIQKKREDIYITNVVKFRPYKLHPTKGTKSNRPPRTSEVNLCLPSLIDEIEVISPRIIVTLGNTALQSVLNDKSTKIGSCHGTKIAYNDSTYLFALYHPASIIYNRALAEVYKDDLQQLSDLIEKTLS